MLRRVATSCTKLEQMPLQISHLYKQKILVSPCLWYFTTQKALHCTLIMKPIYPTNFFQGIEAGVKQVYFTAYTQQQNKSGRAGGDRNQIKLHPRAV